MTTTSGKFESVLRSTTHELWEHSGAETQIHDYKQRTDQYKAMPGRCEGAATAEAAEQGGGWRTQIHIFWRTTKNTVIVQLAIISGRIRVNYHTLAVIIPVV